MKILLSLVFFVFDRRRGVIKILDFDREDEGEDH